MAIVPIALSASRAPDFTFRVTLRFREVWNVAPLGIVGGAVTGMANGALVGVGPVYATIVGMSPERVAIFMGLSFAGAVLLQLPIGALSDRIPRTGAPSSWLQLEP